MMTDSTVPRRAFISGGAALAVTASSVVSAPRPADWNRLRMALVGTGGWQGSDPLGLRANLRAGMQSSLIGIAAYRSIERGGQTIRINDLVL